MDIIRSMNERVEVSKGVERSEPNVVIVGDLAAKLAIIQNSTAASLEDDGRVLLNARTRSLLFRTQISAYLPIR